VSRKLLKRFGERGRNRTFNLLIKSQLLCQLSYAPFQELTSYVGSAVSVEVSVAFCTNFAARWFAASSRAIALATASVEGCT
jgi:hypothetical protein